MSERVASFIAAASGDALLALANSLAAQDELQGRVAALMHDNAVLKERLGEAREALRICLDTLNFVVDRADDVNREALGARDNAKEVFARLPNGGSNG